MSDDLEAKVRASAAELFEPEGVDIWWVYPNRILSGRTPQQAVAEGDADSVLALLEGLKDGVVF